MVVARGRSYGAAPPCVRLAGAASLDPARAHPASAHLEEPVAVGERRPARRRARLPRRAALAANPSRRRGCPSRVDQHDAAHEREVARGRGDQRVAADLERPARRKPRDVALRDQLFLHLRNASRSPCGCGITTSPTRRPRSRAKPAPAFTAARTCATSPVTTKYDLPPSPIAARAASSSTSAVFTATSAATSIF